VSADSSKIRFRRRTLVRDALVSGVPPTRSRVGATAHRGVVVGRPIGRQILVCRWVAVEGGRLECRWSSEDIDGSPIQEPESSLWARIGWSFDVSRSRYRQVFPAVA
jgi:hypothetical protein